MTICCLGDLVLDVIVRLGQPLATGADATSRIVLTPRRPGSERRGLGGCARRPIALRRQARSRRRRARWRPRGCSALGVELVGPVEPEGNGSSSRSSHPSASARCAPTGASRPTSRPEELEPAWFAWLRPPPRLGLCPAARAGPIRCRGRAVAQARARGARVSIDLSSWSAIRDFGPERFRGALEELAPDVVFANEDEDEILGGPLDRVALDPQAGRGRRVVRRRRARSRSRRDGRRLDRSRRRVRRRLARRRAGARAGGRRALRPARRLDARRTTPARSRARRGCAT